jgi:serine/threonine-protein kinase RIO1
MKSKIAQRILSETSLETVKRVRNKYVIEFLENNGFTMKEKDVYSNTSCTVTIFDKYYSVDYWDEDFMEDMSVYTDNLSSSSLAGLLSWMDFIPRGYNK